MPLVVIASPPLTGCRIVVALDQKPSVPVVAPVILPVHAKLPVEPSSVQPVDPEPPARTIPPEPTAPPILRVVATLLNRFWVVALPTMVPA